MQLLAAAVDVVVVVVVVFVVACDHSRCHSVAVVVCVRGYLRS